MKEFKTFIYFFISFLYFELAFKFLIFGFNFSVPFLYNLVFTMIISSILGIICGLFKPKVNKVLYFVFLSIITVWYGLQIIFKQIFNSFFSLSVFTIADQATSFIGLAIYEILKNIFSIIVLIVPIILLIIYRKKIEFKKQNIILNLIVFILTIGSFITSINIFDNDANKLFYKVNNHDNNLEKFGVGISTYLDIKRTILGFEEEIIYNNNEPEIEPPVVTYEYNNLDLNFDKLIENTKDSKVKSMSEYFKNDSGTLKNEYTGFFEGKNLVIFMAESFNEIGVSPELTPTLYKLINSGFSFDNFYTPTNLSTIGGEFQDLTGLIANTSILSKWRKGTNYFPMGLGTVFKNIGYDTFAYHNNSYRFQDRHKYLKSVGLDNYLGIYNGLEKRMEHKWPASDLDMVNVTMDDYINSEKPFLTYYVTVSGHYAYNFTGNNVAKKNKELVSHLDYSEDVKAYLATQIELDRALEALIKKLEEKNLLSNTVIALVADHYPYALSLSHINQVSDYKKDGIIEVNKSNLIIWNSEMETIKVSKYASQVDFIPTLYNLFGIEYDSRLFIGKDILSTEPGLVIFSDRSWVSDYGKYYSSKKKFEPFEGVEIKDDYVEKINVIVANKINMSKLIISKDYYKLIYEQN